MRVAAERTLTMTTSPAIDPKKPIPAIPPLGWRREIPVYRISRDTMPAPKDRFKFEPPFSQQGDASTWQYGECPYRTGDVISTTCWPNPGTMIALNYSAQQVLEYFGGAQKSRLAIAPWKDGRIALDDGLSGPNQPTFNIKTGAAA
jgi:hypothetical protein